MNNVLLVLGQAQAGPMDMMKQFALPVLVMVIFYFFMIRPQMKRQKELKTFREALKEGDKVVTTGGIYGKVTAIKENVITLKVDTNTNLKVDKSTVLKDISDAQPQK